MNLDDIINTLVKYEGISKEILLLIKKTYGKDFIEDTINSKNTEKRERHNTNEIVNYYNNTLSKYPDKQKKEIRIITALHFKISEKAIQYHIGKYKKNTKS